MLRHLRARRRPNSAAHLCALTAAVLLLLSVSILYLRLSSPSSPLPLSLSTPLFPDPFLDSDPDDLNSSSKSDDRIDELDDVVSDDPLNFDDDNVPDPSSFKGYFLDHSTGSIRRAFDKRSIDQWEDYLGFSDANLGLGFVGNVDDLAGKGVFGSDDIVVDSNVRRKAAEVKGIEELLMVNKKAGAFGLREGWGDWFDKKSDFLRRDRMFKSNLELLNVMNYPLLQDPDGVGGLSRGDKLVLKGLLSEFKKVPFLGKKANEGSGVKGVERRTLDDDNGRNEKVVAVGGGGDDGKGVDNVNGNVEVKSEFSGQIYADGRRWGYYPGLDGRLSFSNFVDAFFRKGKCSLRVFMVWNSPAWAFSVRHQRGLESLLFLHRDACVMMFSETIELNFFDGFVKEGYKITVAMPNLDELLKDTPTHIFASVWFEWKKTKFYPTHFSELVRLAALYKYGGIYLDTDIVVLRPLSSLNNTVALEDERGRHNLNGAVMAFRKHSPFILDCLTEFYSTYDDTNLRWNGAELLTRVSRSFLTKRNHSNKQMELKLLPSSAFFPISRANITSFFTAPASESERALHDDLLNRILNESLAFHFWNSLTSALLPEPDSLVARLINHHCIRCSDVL